MKPWRKIYRDIFENEDLGVMSGDAFQLFTAMIVYADDEGRIKASPAYLRGKAFRYRDDVKITDVQVWRDFLAAEEFIAIYTVDGEDYAYHRNWTKWQGKRADRFEPSKIPPPPPINKDTNRQPLGNHMATNRQPLGNPEEIRGEERTREGIAEMDILNDDYNRIVTDKDNLDAPPAPALKAGENRGKPGETQGKAAEADADSADGTVKEADILALAEHYCGLKDMTFPTPAARDICLRSRDVYFPAKDILTAVGGDLSVAKMVLDNHAAFYPSEGKPDWKLRWIPGEDLQAWIEDWRNHEQEKRVPGK